MSEDNKIKKVPQPPVPSGIEKARASSGKLAVIAQGIVLAAAALSVPSTGLAIILWVFVVLNALGLAIR